MMPTERMKCSRHYEKDVREFLHVMKPVEAQCLDIIVGKYIMMGGVATVRLYD